MTPPKDPTPQDGDVLAGLSRTRPQRRSGHRDDASAKPAPDPGSPAAEARPTAPAKPGPAAAAPKAPKPGAARAKAKPGPKPKRAPAGAAGAGRPTAPPDTGAARGPAPKRAAKADAPGATTPPAPQAGYATPEEADADGPAALLGTAARAVGEATQLGVALGRQALKSVLSRLPKP